jgi:hypothetical protein
MLLNLANSLRLSTSAREAFFICASGIEESELSSSTISPTQTLTDLSEKLTQFQTPGFITDCFGDILFVNPACFFIYNTTPQKLSSPNLLSQFNIIRILLAHEFEEQHHMMGETIHTFARRTVLLYKAMTIKYRTNWYFQLILPELNRIPLFREHWQSPVFHDEDVFINYNTIQLNHPQLGMISFFSSPIQATTPYGDLNLYSFQPLDSHTAQACAQIIKQVGTTPIKIGDWPKKQISR